MLRTIALAALVATSGAVQAQEAWTEVEDGSMMVEALGMTVDELDGMALYDGTGERIGELDDILVGQDGSTLAASLDIGGFLGLGEKDVVVPLDGLTRSDDGLTTMMSQEELEALPEHDD